jgi:hypothetical protein
MVDVVAATSNLTVLGGPSSINVELDLGSPGQRGSQIFTGNGKPTDPGIQSTLFASNQELINDMYINLDPSSDEYLYLYQYQSLLGVPTWSRLFRLVPNTVLVNPVIRFIGGVAHTIFIDVTNPLSPTPIIIKGLYFPISSFLEAVPDQEVLPSYKDFNIQHNLISRLPAISSINVNGLDTTFNVEVLLDPATMTYAPAQPRDFGGQTLSLSLTALEWVTNALQPINDFRYVHIIATVGGKATDVIDFTPQNVAFSANTITIETHGFTNGEIVTYLNNGNANVGGLTHGLNYIVLVVDANTIRLSSNGITPIDLTDSGTTGTHSLLDYTDISAGA